MDCATPSIPDSTSPTNGIELGRRNVRRQSAALQAARRHQERVLLEPLVDGSRFAQIAFARALPLAAGEVGRVAQHRFESRLGGVDIPPKRNPRQGLAGEFEYVMSHGPVAFPGLRR